MKKLISKKTASAFLFLFMGLLPAQGLWAGPAGNSGFLGILEQGGVMMIPILLLAMAGLTLVLERTIFFLRHRPHREENIDRFLKESEENSLTPFREELESDLKDSLTLYVNQMERGLSLLNGIGNLAPLMGFFGTVVGMISAFAAIAAATTVNAKVVAVGIQMALVTTAGGLAVAVPVLAAFHVFVHLIQRTISKAELRIQEMTNGLPRLSEGPPGE